MTRTIAMVALAVLGGCTDENLGYVAPLVRHGFERRISQPGEVAVDLLVVVDDSHSMWHEQVNLGENFQHLVRALTSPPDTDGDGQPDHEAVTDLHVGIVSTNLGVMGVPSIDSCEDALDGDDGVLLSTHHPRRDANGQVIEDDCDDTYPSFLAYDPTSTSDRVYRTPEELDAAFQCIALLGTDGCGYEQPLDAMARALDVHARAGGANDGFLRDDSILAVVVLTDEEDCSVDRDLPNASDLYSNAALGDPSLRCFRYGDQYLTPVQAFVDRLIALRAGEPQKLVLAGITGIPLETSCALTDMGDTDFACVLAEPRMQQVVATGGHELEPACLVEGRGKAEPARRIVQAIQGVDAGGGSGIVRSICEGDYRPAMEAISRLIQKQFDGACLARSLDRDADGQVACRVLETLDDDRACPPGRVDLGLSDEGLRVCQVCQEGDGEPGNLVDGVGTDLRGCADDVAAGHSWHYVDDAPDCDAGRIAFLGDAIAREGSDVHLECLSAVDEHESSIGE